MCVCVCKYEAFNSSQMKRMHSFVRWLANNSSTVSINYTRAKMFYSSHLSAVKKVSLKKERVFPTLH